MAADLKILHEYTNLNYLKVTVDDMEIMGGDLISLQVDQSFTAGGLVGKLEFKDTFDIFNNSVTTFNNNNVVTVSFKDFSLESSVRTYRITNISHRKYGERFRIVSLTLIDEVTYLLSETYTDKYSSGDCVSGIKSLIEDICGDVIDSNLLTLDVTANTESADSTMLVNSSQNLLEYIVTKLAKYNLRLFQTRDTIYIKELVPADLTALEYDFTDKTMNNKYLYKIFDREQITVNNMTTPKTINYRIDGKDINTDTKNFEDLEDDLLLNSNIVDTSYIQGTDVKMVAQAIQSEGVQKMKIFDRFISTNRLIIAVPGTILGGNIDTVITCTFNGLVGFSDITTEGDTMNSGNYYVVGVSDLFIGQKYIQRLTTARTENLLPRDKS